MQLIAVLCEQKFYFEIEKTNLLIAKSRDIVSFHNLSAKMIDSFRVLQSLWLQIGANATKDIALP